MEFDVLQLSWYTAATREGYALFVDDLLTTKQLQDLLQVDRITIYRMLGDGRLHGFKVGGQWRFSRQEIEAWLQEQQSGMDGISSPPAADEAAAPISHALPLSCIQAIQDVCAEALDIAAVTIDVDGSSLSNISNPCEYCRLILTREEGRRRCAADWRQVEDSRVHHCHAGLQCVSAPVQVGGRRVAVTAGCQFATEALDGTGQLWRARLPLVAAELGLAEQDLHSVVGSVRVVPEAHLPRISQLIVRVADTFSEIGQERFALLSRLQHIAEMSRI
jgi:excisionase family DNA binding protein